MVLIGDNKKAESEDRSDRVETILTEPTAWLLVSFQGKLHSLATKYILTQSGTGGSDNDVALGC